MLGVDSHKLAAILASFGICDELELVEELLRGGCDGDKLDENYNEMKLIYKVCFLSREPVVVKFRGGRVQRNTRKVIEQQSKFAGVLRENGISTPQYYKADGAYTQKAELGGYNFIVTVEDFVENEIENVDESIAYKTGFLLAGSHNISEKFDCHVPNHVLFDPFSKNELFAFEAFQKLRPELPEECSALYHVICDIYEKKLKLVEPLKNRKRYAVQGDISDCNTYQSEDGSVGVFDFNCCGDNVIFCDAVMQGWFEAHLMGYKEPITKALSARIFESFLSGYHLARPFTDEEKALIPALYSIIDAFESGLILYNDDSLEKSVKTGDIATARKHLNTIKANIESEIDVGYLV